MNFFLKHKFKTLLVVFAYIFAYFASTVISTALLDRISYFGAIAGLSLVLCSLFVGISVIILHLHSVSYRVVSFPELFKVALISTGTLIINLILWIFIPEVSFVWCVICFLFFFVFSAFLLCHRRLYLLILNTRRNNGSRYTRRVIIIGAGEAGINILKEIRFSDKINYEPLGFVDDNVGLHGSYILGLKVLGASCDIKRIAKETGAELIIVAIPSAKPADIKRISEYCIDTGCEVKVLPGMYQLIDGKVSVTRLRNVDVADLLGRDPVSVDLDEVMGYIEGKTVLVTGGGGSIGSELCRQIASKKPKQLIILDIYENNAYDIEQELIRKVPELNLLALIASVRDLGKMEAVFDKYRPELVFHAAAHKHVPLMETSPNEAVKNNVIGTYNVVRCADKYGVKRFVQISTDKAVNPTNIMGATKRVCEMIIQAYAKKSETRFVAVRFGNVLGSNGSVIPLFKRQIAEGGPVTVTHKDIIRYFMTIPEAVSLVLQAGAYAKGGEIYVLDMGEQVKIYDLAINLIKLMGYEPFVDIDIKVTGLRPGEKLYEERLMAEEGLVKTPNGLISIARPIPMDEDALWEKLDMLKAAAYDECDEMKRLMCELVPTYHVDDKNN